MKSSEEKLNTVKDLMSRFKVSDKTVRRWINSGQIEVLYLDRQIRIPETEVKRFMDLRRRSRSRW